MRILYKEPGKDPRTMVIPNKLEVMQQLVGGYIEAHRFLKDVVIICNEEGRLLGLEPNCYGTSGGDFYVGPVILVGEDGDEFTDIPEDRVEIVTKMLKHGRE